MSVVPGTRFPELVGRTLLGDEVTMPGDLPAERTLVVVAFKQWHQNTVDRWIARAVAAGVPGTPRGFDGPMTSAVIEVPAIGTQWRPVRRFIDGGMSSSIGDPDVLARTITVYTDVPALQRALAIPGSDHVWALVVTRDGDILARAQGAPDDEAWEALATELL
jgi:hypothetical protein